MYRPLALLLCLLLVGVVSAAQLPPFPSTVTAPEDDVDLQAEDLRGKIGLVVFYQSWCGVCNGWSPTLLRQMEAAYGEDPRFALIAIKTDSGGPAEAVNYLKEHGANPARWYVLADADAAYYKQFQADTPLWGYVLVAPDGSVLETGRAGSFYERNGGKQFSLAVKKDGLLKQHGAATRTVLPEDLKLPLELQPARRAVEVSRWIDAFRLTQAGASAAPAEAKGLTDLLKERIAERVQVLSASLEAAAGDERFLAYVELRDLCLQLKGLDTVEAATDLVRDLGRDRDIKQEERAEAAYRRLQEAVADLPAAERQQALKVNLAKIAKRFADTYYGRLAAGG